jgi:hypothetical protein
MRKTFLAAVLAASPFAASAADLPLSYTFAEAGYTHVKLDDDFLEDPSLGGGYIRGSVAIADSAYVFGSWSQASKTYRYDDLRLKVTLDQPEAGIGYHMPFADRLDFIADLAYVRMGVKAKASLDGVSATDRDHINVGRVSAGVRGKPSAQTELWLKAGYFDGSDLDEGKFVGTLGGQVSFSRTWGLVGEVQVYDGTTQASVGVRASF